MRYRAYPRYKPSGVEWLGEVPEHWGVKRLKYSASINDEALPETTDPNFEMKYVDIGSVDATRGIVASEDIVFENAPSRARRVVRDGDTVVSTVRTYLRAIAPVRNPASNIIVSTGFAVVRPRRVSPAFLSYALREPGLVEAIVARSVGVSYPAVNAAEIGMLPIPLPAEPEQAAIADFLDRETLMLDTLVAKKRTLIERLKEKRTALISRTVTRGLPPDAARAAGLDPHSKLKPSGIDWLGEVPQHWSAKPLGRLVRFAGGATPDKGKPEYWDGEIPWVSPKDMKVMRIANVPDHVTQEGVANSALILLPVKSVLIVVRGMILAHFFPVAITDVSVTINQDMNAIEVGTQLEAEFILWVLTGIAPVFVSLADESAHGTRKLESEVIAKVCLPVPPRDEQLAIVAFLERETSRLDAMIAKIETAIDRLQEYRTALITAAVTGRIDVRPSLEASAT
jgi:type I restriction enzyme, S subunit